MKYYIEKIKLITIEDVIKFNKILIDYTSDCYIEQDNYRVNGKSILGIYSLDLLRPIFVYSDIEITQLLKDFKKDI